MTTKKEIREMLKDKFKEISRIEFYKLKNEGEILIYVEGVYLYFKPKQKYPIVIDLTNYKLEVFKDGSINIRCLHNDEIRACFFDSLPQLYEAVEISKKLRGNND